MNKIEMAALRRALAALKADVRAVLLLALAVGSAHGVKLTASNLTAQVEVLTIDPALRANRECALALANEFLARREDG